MIFDHNLLISGLKTKLKLQIRISSNKNNDGMCTINVYEYVCASSAAFYLFICIYCSSLVVLYSCPTIMLLF